MRFFGEIPPFQCQATKRHLVNNTVKRPLKTMKNEMINSFGGLGCCFLIQTRLDKKTTAQPPKKDKFIISLFFISRSQVHRFSNSVLVKCRFVPSLTRGISPKICKLRVCVIIDNRSFEPFMSVFGSLS